MSKIEDYPKNYQEFLARFRNEEDCRDYIIKLRWTNGFKCGKCGCGEYYVNNRKVIECGGCGNQSSATSGTILHGTRKPLLLWFHVCLLYTSDAADDLLCVDLGGRRIIKKKKNNTIK